jgi:hypothetical protein
MARANDLAILDADEQPLRKEAGRDVIGVIFLLCQNAGDSSVDRNL